MMMQLELQCGSKKGPPHQYTPFKPFSWQFLKFLALPPQTKQITFDCIS